MYSNLLQFIAKKRDAPSSQGGSGEDPPFVPPSGNLAGRKGDYNDAMVTEWKARWNGTSSVNMNLGSGYITFAGQKAYIAGEADRIGIEDNQLEEFIWTNAYLLPSNDQGLLAGQVAYLPPSRAQYLNNFADLYSNRVYMVFKSFVALMNDDNTLKQQILDVCYNQSQVELTKLLTGVNPNTGNLYWGQNGQYQNGNTIFEVGKTMFTMSRTLSYIESIVDEPTLTASQRADNLSKWNACMAYLDENYLWLNTQAYIHMLNQVNNVTLSDVINGTGFGTSPESWSIKENPFNFSRPTSLNNNNGSMPNYAYQDASGNRLRRIYTAQATINNATISVNFGGGLHYYMTGATNAFAANAIDNLVKTTLLYGVYPDGRIFNRYRASKYDSQAFLGPREVWTGDYYFTVGQSEMAVKMIADLVNSGGTNTTLWDYSTSLGNATFGTEGGPKTLQNTLEKLEEIEGSGSFNQDYVFDAPTGSDIPSGETRENYRIKWIEDLLLSSAGRKRGLFTNSSTFAFHAEYYNTQKIHDIVDRTGTYGTVLPFENLANGTNVPNGFAQLSWQNGAAGFDIPWHFKYWGFRSVTSVWNTIDGA